MQKLSARLLLILWGLFLIFGVVQAQNITIEKLPVETVQANALGHGYNVSFFERGMSDALNDPDTSRQLAFTLQTINTTTLRFPGGTFTYFYPHVEAGLQAFKKAGFAEESYNLWQPEQFGWASEKAFFNFCKQAGITAWYEINPGYIYDEERDVIGQLAPMARTNRKVKTVQDYDYYLPMAIKRIAELAKWCKAQNISVVWEIGNEDYVNFEPEAYAKVATVFINTIREVDPQARVAVCGDSESWSTRDWQRRVLEVLQEENIGKLDFASVHCYLTGVGWFDETDQWHAPVHKTGADFYREAVRGYRDIRNMYTGEYRKILDETGFADTQFAFTEFNPVHPAQISGDALKLEHCLGRVLGEATLYPWVIEDSGAWFSHDLVRSSTADGTWFRRIDYTPKAHQKYALPLEAQIIGLVSIHSHGQIIYKDWDGVCVSVHPWGIYATVANATGDERKITLSLPANINFSRPQSDMILAWGLEAVDYDFERHQFAGPEIINGQMTLNAPAFGFLAVRLSRL